MDQRDIDDWQRVVAVAMTRESGQTVPVEADLVIAVDGCLIRGDLDGRFLAGFLAGSSFVVGLAAIGLGFAAIHGWLGW